MRPIFDVRRREPVRIRKMGRERNAIGWLRQIVADGERAETVAEMTTEPRVVLPPPGRPDAAERAERMAPRVGAGSAVEVEAVDEPARDVGFGELGADQCADEAHVRFEIL